MSVQDVRAAAERLAGKVIRTPAVRCPALDARAGAELWLKAENLQRIGAFKARGALHAVGRLAPEARERGIITYSSGNHAQAVALAAKEYGIRATIAMPIDAPAIKVAGVRALGAEIVLAGTTSDQRRAAALELQAVTGGTIIEPFDDADVIAGQGTATLELLEQAGGQLDAIVVPVGGGGLVAGACLVAEDAGIEVYTAEPRTCNAMARSMAEGERVAVTPGPTLADGLKPVRVGALNFDIARRAIRGCFEVEDDELGRALVALLVHAKLLAEPSGVAGLAAALRGEFFKGKKVGVLLSGGNVEPALVAGLIARHAETG